jgi:C4-dicarboxylate-specific signal transduction histidine kinase
MARNADGRPRRLTIASAVEHGAVRVTFRDTGPGVPRPLRSRLFQPFFTTKEVGQGTGLGLSVSYRILQEHRGSLAFDDAVDDGAGFVVSLPIAPVTSGSGR